MSITPDPIAITISRDELVALLQRIIREELQRFAQNSHRSLLDDWSQEGVDDPAADAALLADVLRTREARVAARIPWSIAKTELARAEEAGELSD